MTGREARASAVSGPVVDARILDAALQVLTDVGAERATVELVAEVAGVAPTTVCRRWGTRNSLLQAAVAREIAAAFDAALGRLDEGSSVEDNVVMVFTEVVWSVHTHAWMVRELRTEPDTVLPLFTIESAPVLSAAVDVVTRRLQVLAEAAGARLDDPRSVAEFLVRLAHAVVLVPDPGRSLHSRADVERYARRHVGPVVGHAVAGGFVGTHLHDPPGLMGCPPDLINLESIDSSAQSRARRAHGRTGTGRRGWTHVELLAAAVLVVVVGSVTLLALQPRQQPSVTPTDNTTSVREVAPDGGEAGRSAPVPTAPVSSIVSTAVEAPPEPAPPVAPTPAAAPTIARDPTADSSPNASGEADASPPAGPPVLATQPAAPAPMVRPAAPGTSPAVTSGGRSAPSPARSGGPGKGHPGR